MGNHTTSSSYWIPLIFVSFLLLLCLLINTLIFSSPSSTYNDKIPFRYQYYNPNCLNDQQCSSNSNNNIENNSDTIVIIPGLDGATAFFENIIPIFTSNPNGYSVLVYNLPLYTKEMKDADYNFEYLANQLNDILDELEIKNIHIVGESFGGVVAQYFAVLHKSKTKSLVLLSSLAKTLLPPFILWKLTYLLPILKFIGFLFPGLGQALFARLHVDDVIEPSESQYVKDMFIKEASVAHFRSVMKRINIVSKLNIEEQSRTLRVPTTIVYGNDDHFTKASSMKLFHLIDNSKLVGMKGGHLPHITQPKEFASIVFDFLRSIRINNNDNDKDYNINNNHEIKETVTKYGSI